MKIFEVQEILPRRADDRLNLVLYSYSDQIDQVVNKGTHVLKWDVEKKRAGKDHSIPSLIFRNLIELGDSISVQLRQSSVDPAKTTLRSLFEGYLSIIHN